jgi:multidrug efflux pump subunit AcrB
VEATREIGLAVMATTLSLIAVFLPIAFLGGIPGRFLKSFGLTMAFSIAVSLFVSFTLTPMLASRWLAAKRAGKRKTVLERVVDVVYRPLEHGYGRVSASACATAGSCSSPPSRAFLSTVPLAAVAKKGFLPIDDRAQFEVIARLPEGRSVAATELVGERIARLVRELPEVTATLVTVGDDENRNRQPGAVYVKLLPPDRARARRSSSRTWCARRCCRRCPGSCG